MVLCLCIGYLWGTYGPVIRTLYAPHQEQSATAQKGATTSASQSGSSSQIPATGVNVSTKLTDAQKQMLKNMGINPDTLVITPSMAACAEAKLGVARMSEIQNGATPSLLESAELLACYKQ